MKLKALSNKKVSAVITLLILTMLASGCANKPSASADFPDEIYTSEMTIEEALTDTMVPLASAPGGTTFLKSEASGTVVYTGSKAVTVDASNTADGYVMVKCEKSTSKLKVIITGPSLVKYTYNLNNHGNFETFGLPDGNGSYSIGVYENIAGTKYSVLLNKKFDVKLKDEFAPFLYPNQYVNFNEKSKAVEKAKELTKNDSTELEKVESIYDFVIKNISYDYEKAKTVQSGYLPDVDTVLDTKKGICFDYASLMTSMLRSLNVPTKLVVGYTGNTYHAWISTYSPETGWVEGVIFFDGTTWKLMDPTFASTGNSSEDIMKYIGNGKNYTEKYIY